MIGENGERLQKVSLFAALFIFCAPMRFLQLSVAQMASRVSRLYIGNMIYYFYHILILYKYRLGGAPFSEDAMSLGENIYKHRNARNWSQTELAEALEVSRQSISKWENNMATPELDKVVRMSQLFEISLDELVLDKQPTRQKAPAQLTERQMPSFRVMAGVLLLVFGMIMFLLSVFWGDHLYFGEVFGELVSAVIVLISIAIIQPYDLRVLAVCSSIYLIYMVVCFGVLRISNAINSLFTLIASFVILIWFIVCGQHANADPSKK